MEKIDDGLFCYEKVGWCEETKSVMLTCRNKHRYNDFAMMSDTEVCVSKHFGDHESEGGTTVCIKQSGYGQLHDLIIAAERFYIGYCDVYPAQIETDIR